MPPQGGVVRRHDRWMQAFSGLALMEALSAWWSPAGARSSDDGRVPCRYHRGGCWRHQPPALPRGFPWGLPPARMWWLAPRPPSSSGASISRTKSRCPGMRIRARGWR